MNEDKFKCHCPAEPKKTPKDAERAPKMSKVPETSLASAGKSKEVDEGERTF